MFSRIGKYVSGLIYKIRVWWNPKKYEQPRKLKPWPPEEFKFCKHSKSVSYIR
jgi:hypothetical protein